VKLDGCFIDQSMNELLISPYFEAMVSSSFSM